MNWDSVLNQLSAPGLNRPVGAGDVNPFQSTTLPGQTTGDQQTVAGASAATPGPSGTFGPATPGASGAFDPSSFLANLSSFMPMLNQLINQHAQAAVPSGQGNAQAQPAAQATTGPSSADLGAMQPAGAPASGPPPGFAPDLVHGGYAPIPNWTPDSSGLSGGEGAPGGAAGAPGDSGGAPGDGPGGGVSGGAGVYKKGGLVTQGNPKSKVDDVPAKLQHGEFVIPRDAMHHLAVTAPGVLSHVMQVSAAHALADKARSMQHPAGPSQMAQMGPSIASQGRPPVLPPIAQAGAPPQGLKDGGQVY
jgi:hypothetical protein